MSGVFGDILGAAIDRLPPRVRRLHAEPGARTYRGEADVDRGTNAIARLCGAVTGLPPAARGAPLAVEIAKSPGREQWTRRFGAHTMRSRMWRDGALLRERLGPVTFAFSLTVEGASIADARLVWTVVGASALGVPLPARWFSGVRAEEFERDGRYRFLVDARLPLIGRLVRYEGALDVDVG